MAKKRASSPTKKAVKTATKVAAAGYAYRVTIAGNAAKRKGQVQAVKNDARRVGRGAAKVANTKAGKKVRATKAGSSVERGGRKAVTKGKSFAGKGPGDLARNVKKSVRRKGEPKYKGPSKTGMAGRRVKAGYQAEKAGLTKHSGFGGSIAQSKTHRVGVGTAKAVTHMSNHKGQYALGTAATVAVGGAGVYAYKKHKAKTAGSGSVTYKRRTKSGKVITVTRRKGKR